MHVSSAAIRYRPLSDLDMDGSTKIYELHIQDLLHALKLFSYCLILYCIGFSMYFIVTEPYSEPTLNWTEIILHGLGIFIGIIGVKNTNSKSRSLSRNFFFLMILLDLVYIGVQAYQIFGMKNYGNVKTNEEDYKKYVKICLIIVTAFILVLITVKSYLFHIIQAKIIEKNNEIPVTVGELYYTPEIN